MRRVLVGLLAGVITVLLAAPAHAVADDATDRPEVLWPLTKAPDGQADLVIMGANLWGLRTFAKEADGELDGVRIFRHGKCRDHKWATCVRVHHEDLGDNGVLAWTTFDDEHGHRDITINTHYDETDPALRYAIMCHEFGHVLGMQHHKMHGVDGGWSNEVHLSSSEQRALNRAY
jgi:hypothetical protein